MRTSAWKWFAASAVIALLPIEAGLAKQEPAPPFNPTHPWMSDLDEALAESKKSGKPILLEFR